MKHVDRCKHLMQIICSDDLNFRPEDLVACSVIVMPMCVDDVSYRLVSELLDIFNEGPGSRGRGARIYNHNVRIVDYNHIVAAEPGPSDRRVIDAIGDLLELVCAPLHHGIVLRHGLCLCREIGRDAKPHDRCENAYPHDNLPRFREQCAARCGPYDSGEIVCHYDCSRRPPSTI